MAGIHTPSFPTSVSGCLVWNGAEHRVRAGVCRAAHECALVRDAAARVGGKLRACWQRVDGGVR
eukprot:1645893-Rhodomonas_salina.1